MKNPKIAVSINLDWPLRRYLELSKGIQTYAAENTDWRLVWDHFPERLLSESKSTPYYAGVVGRIKYEAYDEIKRLGISAVNTWYTSSLNDITSVFSDYFVSGQMTAEHLIKRGYRNFVDIEVRACKTGKDFRDGFMSVVKPYKCSIKRYLISHKVNTNSTLWNKLHHDFEKWTKDWKYPLAIITSSCFVGPVITTRCMENGLRIPEDIAVVSTGNDLAYCEGLMPEISSIDLDTFKVGYEAARLLHKQMKGEKIDQKVTMIKPRGLVARESTDSYTVEDKEVKCALRYIAESFHNNIQVGDVVNVVAVGRSTLERRFRSTIGHTIVDEINRLRISSAKRYMIESDMEIKRISRECGFSSPHHLIRVFLNSTGMKPSEFRKSHKI